MNLDYSLTTVLLACALFILGSFAGWCARGSQSKRARHADARQAEPAPQGEAGRANQDQAAERGETATSRADRMSLHEWDGGSPRPNWNRQRNLNVMG